MLRSKLRLICLLAALALLAYLLVWPIPVEPVAWTPSASRGYQKEQAPNSLLAHLRRIELGGDEGPEHLAFGPDGKLYAAVASGQVLRMNADGSGREVFAHSAGRVLGFAFTPNGQFVAADAELGLIAIDAQGNVQVLVDRVAGAGPVVYADAVTVGADGRIYFSDASARFSPKQWGSFDASVLDLAEQSATGRVLVYDPATRSTRVLARGLSFANGVELSEDGRSLFVAETGRYRVWRIDIAAQDLDLSQPSPRAQPVLDGLPGYPDNLTRGRDGRLWLGLTQPRNTAGDALAAWPFVRKMVLRLPRMFWRMPPARGHVIAFTEDGRVVADLQDPQGAYPDTTGATETRQGLYIHSLHANWIGWMPLPPGLLESTPSGR